jgi:GT2 family glycosyltransferase
MSEKPRVSVIIVNWNGEEHLRLCLPSLATQSFKSLEIIVVDNRSSDDSAKVARSLGARWLPLEENLGLAPALNRGAAIARGDLLLFVNNDMRFDPGFVAALAAPLERDEEIFATDGMQFDWDGTVRGHLATRLTNVPPKRDSSTELVPGLYFYQQEQTGESPVFMASAACMMVRRTLFEKIGGFDDRLPLGYEDVEISWRAWVHRWKILYVPTAICWHRVGSSVGSLEGARFSFRGILKGRLLLATKLLPARYAFRTWLVSMVGLAKDIGRLRWKFASDRIGVLLHMAGLVGQLLREKRALFKNANSSPKEQLDVLLRLTDVDVGLSEAKRGKK